SGGAVVGAGPDGPHDGAVHPVDDVVREGHGRVDEPGGGEAVEVLAAGQRAGDAAGVVAALGALRGVEVVLGDDVGDDEAPARCEDAVRLAQHRGLVHGEVDHAVGDDDVHRGVGQRQPLDEALVDLDVRRAGLGDVAAGEGDHLRRHVDAVDAPGGADRPRGE